MGWNKKNSKKMNKNRIKNSKKIEQEIIKIVKK